MADSKILRLAAELLNMASDVYSNHGCNDFDLPSAWTEQDKQRFLIGYEMWNSGGAEKTNEYIHDYAAMSYVAWLLEQEAGDD